MTKGDRGVVCKSGSFCDLTKHKIRHLSLQKVVLFCAFKQNTKPVTFTNY